MLVKHVYICLAGKVAIESWLIFSLGFFWVCVDKTGKKLVGLW